jgi:hypothetical protein
VVRGLVRAKLTGPSGDKEVLREILLAYHAKQTSGGLVVLPVFAAEVTRSIGADRVEAKVKVVAAKGTTPGKIEIAKGTAKGFTKSTWPFGAESPSPGLEPLILPWGTDNSITYGWNGEKLTR